MVAEELYEQALTAIKAIMENRDAKVTDIRIDLNTLIDEIYVLIDTLKDYEIEEE